MGVKRDSQGIELQDNKSIISEDEAALYDRQIRLWGLGCQKKLRDARILIVGINGLGAEVVKNITLSGVNSITILDNKPVTELDKCAQFFVSGANLGESRGKASKAAIAELNPNVKIIIDEDDVENKPDEFFHGFSTVLATDLPVGTLVRIDKICHNKRVHFFCGQSWGFYGYFFADLGKTHAYSVETKDPKAVKETAGTSYKVQSKKYCVLETTLEAKVGSGLRKKKLSGIFPLMHIMNAFRETNKRFPQPATKEADLTALQHLREETCEKLGCNPEIVSDEMLRDCFGEISPVCAAVGGILAGEIVKSLAQKFAPIDNFFLFDGNNSSGIEETVNLSE